MVDNQQAGVREDLFHPQTEQAIGRSPQWAGDRDNIDVLRIHFGDSQRHLDRLDWQCATLVSAAKLLLFDSSNNLAILGKRASGVIPQSTKPNRPHTRRSLSMDRSRPNAVNT